MKKAFKEEMKEMLKDDSYSWNDKPDSDSRSLKIKCLEEAVNLVRFELFYPKMEIEYDMNKNTDKFPRGAFSAALANMFFCSYMAGEDRRLEGALFGGACTFAQMIIGTRIRKGAKYISDKYKKFRGKEINPEDKDKTYI